MKQRIITDMIICVYVKIRISLNSKKYISIPF
jgi:hypothetical protein